MEAAPSPLSSRPERSEVEGSAVSFHPLNRRLVEPPPCPLSSRAQPRDLRSCHSQLEFRWKLRPPLCHPDRSGAKWRDLQFSGPLLEMFFERANRSRGPAFPPSTNP